MYLTRFTNANVNTNTFVSGQKIVKLQDSNVLVNIRTDVSMRTIVL